MVLAEGFIQEPHCKPHAQQRPLGRSENCFETRICFCNRRSDLLPCQKERVLLGGDEAVHSAALPSAFRKGALRPILAVLVVSAGPASGSSTVEGSVSVTGSACLRTLPCTLVRLCLRILVQTTGACRRVWAEMAAKRATLDADTANRWAQIKTLARDTGTETPRCSEGLQGAVVINTL